MKYIISLILGLMLSISETTFAQGIPIGEPVVVVFASGNQVQAVISGIAIDPVTGVYQFQFQANPEAFAKDTVVGGFVKDEIVDIRFVNSGDSLVNGPGGPGGAGNGSGSGNGQSGGNQTGSGSGVGGVIGGAIGDGLVAGGTAALVGILSSGSSSSEIWKKMNKTAGIVRGLLKAYADYRQSIQQNGSQNTGIVKDAQDRQKKAFEKNLSDSPNFQTTEPIREQIDKQWNRYRDIQPKNPQESRLKSAGQDLLENADRLSVQGERSAAELSLKYATDIADVLVGIDPFTGAIRNTYELYTGINLVTGETLTEFERSMAAVGVLLDLATFGTGGTLLRGAKALGKVFAGADAAKAVQAATKTVELLEKVPSVATRNGLLYSDMKVVSSEVANASHKVAAWSSKQGVIVEGTLKNTERYVRFYSEGSSKPLSEWVAHHGLEGKSVAQMVKGLALPSMPNRLAVVEVPAGTRVRFGFSAEAFGKPGGMIQHQILNSPVNGGASLLTPFQAIKTDVPLNQVLNANQTFINLKGVL